jgi:hypothetical protein
MDAFNFAFSLFAIVLGLALVEVLTGFARALKRRHVVHLGWVTPIAAIYVMLDLTSFWEFGWGSRRFISPQYGYLLIGLGNRRSGSLRRTLKVQLLSGAVGQRSNSDRLLGPYFVHVALLGPAATVA